MRPGILSGYESWAAWDPHKAYLGCYTGPRGGRRLLLTEVLLANKDTHRPRDLRYRGYSKLRTHTALGPYRGISAIRNQNLRNHTGFCPPVLLI